MKVIKKDGTKEKFNIEKVITAVNKSAFRVLVSFTQEDLDFICKFVYEAADKMVRQK